MINNNNGSAANAHDIRVHKQYKICNIIVKMQMKGFTRRLVTGVHEMVEEIIFDGILRER